MDTFHVCDICNESFPNKSRLVSHRTTHYKGAYNCPLGCGKTYKSSKTFSNHMEKVHHGMATFSPTEGTYLPVGKEPSNPCPDCALPFDSLKDLSNHIDECHSETENFVKLYKCADCSYVVKEFDNFVQHCITHSKDDPLVEIDKDAATLYQCKQCTVICNSYDDWLDHLMKYHDETTCEPFLNNRTVEENDDEFVGNGEAMEIDKDMAEPIDKRDLIEAEVLTDEPADDDMVKNAIYDLKLSDKRIDVETAEMETIADRKCNNSDAENYVVEYLDEQFLSDNVNSTDKIDYGEIEYLEDEEDTSSDESEEENSQHHVRSDPNEITSKGVESLKCSFGVEAKVLYKCKICFFKYKNKIDLDEHMKVHICELCNKLFKTKNYLIQHNKRVHSLPEQKCLRCGKVFKKSNALEKHKCFGKIYPTGNTCHICDDFYEDKQKLIDHFKTHSAAIPEYKCQECGETFSRKFFLTLHLRRHKKSTFICSTCKKHYKMKKDYLLHIERCGILPALICNICGFTGFKEEASYLVHLKRHRGEDCYDCELCDATFKLKRDLKAHVLTHIDTFENVDEEKKYGEEWLEEYLSDDFNTN